jgi:hypothetical protein
MKTDQKALLVVALLIVVGGGYAAYRMHNVQKSDYPMAGEVTIMDKFESGDEHYIVMEESTGEQFTLSCSASDYDAVDVGDQVNCERSQSIVTHKGKVHTIKPLH